MAYPDAFGRWGRFGDEPPDPCPDLSGRDRFKAASRSQAGEFTSLITEGAAAEPTLPVNTSGGAPKTASLSQLMGHSVRATPPPSAP